jgi:site-specific DNA-methyltransferase (adenine-specific)
MTEGVHGHEHEHEKDIQIKREVLIDFNVKIELVVDDCLKVMQRLPAGDFHLAVLDPPYLFTEAPRIRREHLPAVKADIDWESVFQTVYRVLKDEAMLLLFGNVCTFAVLWDTIRSAGFKYVTSIVWVKDLPVNYLKAKVKPLNQHETITVWKKGRIRYNWEEAMSHGHKPYKVIRSYECTFYDVRRVSAKNDGSRYMTNVIFAPTKPTMPLDERTDHPTQKPLVLIERLVRAFSYRNENVIDPFAGSGTTLVACARTGRNCLGIEINEKYADIIRNRIKNLQLSLDSFDKEISDGQQTSEN